MLPKVEARPKGPPFGFFRHYATFFENFRILSKGTLAFFCSFRFVITFNEPEWPLFEFFGMMLLFIENTFLERKKITENTFTNFSSNVFI